MTHYLVNRDRLQAAFHLLKAEQPQCEPEQLWPEACGFCRHFGDLGF
jgi:hypothetical protein